MSRLRTLWQAHRISLAAFALPALLLLAVYALCGIFPFGGRSVLVLDLAGQYVYYFEALHEAVHGGGSLIYSFSRTLGGEFLGMLAYYLASPFSLLVLLFPKERITVAILLILLLKTGFAGFTMTRYLRLRYPTLSVPLRLALGAAYALCGFALAYHSNTMWFDAVLLLPLLIEGLEALIERRGFLLYTLTLSAILLTNYYMGYITAVFCVLYYLYRRFVTGRNFKREFFYNATFFAIFSLIAAFIASVLLFPAAYSLTFGKSDFTIPIPRPAILATPLDLLRKLLPASYDTVMDGAAPFLYCGSFALLLLPCYFLCRHVSRRQKLGDAVLLLLFTAVMIFEPLDRAWHGFSAPNGLPFRYAFLFAFLLLNMAARVLTPADGAATSPKAWRPLALVVTLLTGAVFLFKFTVPTLKESPYFLPVSLSGLLLTATALLLHAYPPRGCKRLTAALLSLVILAELTANGVATLQAMHEDVTFTDEAVFAQSSQSHLAVTEALRAADGGFWRAESTEHLKSNDNLLTSLRGVSGSTSTLHADAIGFLSHVGVPARWHRSTYLSANPVTDSLLGIRYVMSNTDIPLYQSALSAGGLTAFQNPHALSLAYGVKSTEVPAFTVNPAKNCNLLLEHLTGTPCEALVPLETTRTLFGGCSPYASDDGRTVYLPKSEDSVAFLTLTAIAPRDGDLFFTLPSPITSPVYLFVNDVSLGVHFDTACSYVLYLGRFAAGEEVRVRLITADNARPLQPYAGESHFYMYNSAVAEAAYSALSQTQLLLDDSSKDTKLTGTLTTTAPAQAVLFTAPYDANWQVLVDGKRVETTKALGALIAFTVDAPGTHRVELRYVSPQLLTGSIFSLIGVLLLGGAVYTERKKHFFCQ